MKKRRYNIELTPAAAAELDRIRKTGSLKITEVFCYSLMLMKIYVDAKGDGKQMRLVNLKDPKEVQVVELPIFWKESTDVQI